MPRIHEIVFASSDKARSKKIRQDLKAGNLRVLAKRVYTSNLVDSLDTIVNRNWYIILSHLYPNAIISHRSAIEGKPIEGNIFLTYTYTKNTYMPGLNIHLLKGYPKDLGTYHFFENLYRSSEPRKYLENLQTTRSTPSFSKTLGREEIEKSLDTIIRTRGEEAINQLRDEARILAPQIGMEKEFKQLNSIISALLSTHPNKILDSDIAKARSSGLPYDPDRVDLFNILYNYLAGNNFTEYPKKNNSKKANHNFAFFESYFSNFIEGTVFAVEEAHNIIENKTPLPTREDDSHDVLGTYALVSNETEMSITPKSPTEFLDLLRRRHSILLEARTAMRPGEFKQLNNRAGSTEFVDWHLVSGTLSKGFELYTLLKEPFSKAAYMMFLIAEVHPFLDGNGRLARVMMNAELSANNKTKIIIPTVYRTDYLGALKKLTKKREPEIYIKMLHRAYEFSATIDASDFNEMENYLRRCNAFEDEDGKILKF